MRSSLFLCSILFSILTFAQQPSTSASQIKQALEQKEALLKNSIVKNLPFKNIGPSVMSGRVTAIAVNPENPIEFYVGYASGGVWHTTNNGTTFKPILDNSPTQNVGSLAVDWKNRNIWVGTGEVNASRSSYAGIGLLKSSDNGKTWQNMGLVDSHHISSILINPNNPDEIVVSAVGHLYSKNDERGIYKSKDGGKTWRKTLFVNNQSGVIEMVHEPSNFNLMYASSWDKDRKAWNFRGDGPGSAIYKSKDAGSTWEKISTPDSGFPTGDGTGRIGLAVYDENTIYAIHDNQNRRVQEESSEDKESLTKDDFKTMSSEELLALDNKKLKKFLRRNNFKEKHTAEHVKDLVEDGDIKPADVAKYLEDANSMLFDTPVIGAEVYKSVDGGKTWNKTHKGYLDGIYYSYGYYFGKIHVDPNDKDGIYIYGVPILKSKDGGKTFTSISAPNVHADHHALWINPNRPGHLIDGNDGGVNISYDDGKNWIKNNQPSVGQFYTVNVDNEKPYNVYGGLQDNGVWKGPHNYSQSSRWHQSGQYPYKSIMGGDGMQIEIDDRNSNIVYTGFQFGNYFRLDLKNKDRKYIQPKHELGESPYRFNWQTPILLSPHNQDILYLGGNKLMRSMNQGDDWEAISEDLTKGGKKGNVAYGTLTSISESPFQFGLIYAGSDDGLVHVTKDGGNTWVDISNTFPKDLWVSRVIASTHAKKRVFVALNGYRWDDFTPYIFVSEDYGETWKPIASNIPASPVNVIKEDPENENILYAGTDNGLYISFNRGNSWEIFGTDLPNVAMHDLVIQKREKDLIVGTHGRSIYLAEIELLQKLNPDNFSKVVLGKIKTTRASKRWGSKDFNPYGDYYEPEQDIYFYAPDNGDVNIKVTTEDGKTLKEWSQTVDKGVSVATYNLSISNKGEKALRKKDITIEKGDNGIFYLPKGTYKVVVSQANSSAETELIIK
ncbi:MAG: glycosyl hydrolase [Psychroflexus sp.]|nr:glycosyl hydrolase [Psychroflexus sp.]